VQKASLCVDQTEGRGLVEEYEVHLQKLRTWLQKETFLP
jgi:hypothetical protein